MDLTKIDYLCTFNFNTINMKKFFLLATAVMLFSFNLMAGPEKPIGIKQLPQISQTLIQTYFSNLIFEKGTLEGNGQIEYTIKFSNGTELEFNEKGEWTEIDCKTTKVPNGIIPAPIQNYVVSNYKNNKIVKIQKESFGYEVELNNDLELKFNKEGKFLSVDD